MTLRTTLLVVVGGINWGLVAIAKFDLVAFITARAVTTQRGLAVA